MIRRFILMLIVSVAVCYMPGVSAEFLEDEWILGGTTVNVRAQLSPNMEQVGKVIYTKLKTISDTAILPELIARGSLSLNTGNMNLQYQSEVMRNLTSNAYAHSIYMLNLSGWKADDRSVDGFSKDDAIVKSKEALASMGFPVCEPYCVDTFTSENLQDLPKEEDGFYFVYYPVRYQGTPLMPSQIHAKDQVVMEGAHIAIALTADQILYIYMYNNPEQEEEEEVKQQGPIIPIEEALDLYKEMMGEILHDPGISYELFRVAYEYIPENIVGEDFNKVTLYPAWCFYQKMTIGDMIIHDVVAFNALDGSMISR